MPETCTRYFVIDGRPVQVRMGDATAAVLAMDPRTGAMVQDPSVLVRATGEVDRQTYRVQLDRLRQVILERYATTPLQWLWTADPDGTYGLCIDGHEFTIRIGEFPTEPLYLLHVDGQLIYALDDWPSAWRKPGRC